MRQLSFTLERGKYIGREQQLGHHLMDAHSMLRLHLAAGFYHTDGSTTRNYHMVAGGEHLQGTVSKVTLRINQASKQKIR